MSLRLASATAARCRVVPARPSARVRALMVLTTDGDGTWEIDRARARRMCEMQFSIPKASRSARDRSHACEMHMRMQ